MLTLVDCIPGWVLFLSSSLSPATMQCSVCNSELSAYTMCEQVPLTLLQRIHERIIYIAQQRHDANVLVSSSGYWSQFFHCFFTGDTDMPVISDVLQASPVSACQNSRAGCTETHASLLPHLVVLELLPAPYDHREPIFSFAFLKSRLKLS